MKKSDIINRKIKPNYKKEGEENKVSFYHYPQPIYFPKKKRK